VAGLLALALGAMAGIGLFPQGTTSHLPVAVAFYVLVTVLLWADGVVSWRAGRRQRGAGVATLGTGVAGAWLVGRSLTA
jgi:hypothetical membrane protein